MPFMVLRQKPSTGRTSPRGRDRQRCVGSLTAGMALLIGWLGATWGRADEVETLVAPPAVQLPPLGDPADMGYAIGYRIGRQLRADLDSIKVAAEPAAVLKGLREALAGSEPSLSEERFGRVLAGFDARIAARDEAFAREFARLAAENLQRGRAFLAENRERPGVRELPKGVQIEVRKRGVGKRPTLADDVLVHYSGSRLDGEVFDATDPEDGPVRIRLREVIPGWQQAIGQMPTGARWRIVIPAEQAYGEEGAPPVIGPNEVLIFEIELVAISPPE